MATFDYAKTLATAQRLLAKFGNPVTMTRSYDQALWVKTYDPVTEVFTYTNISSGIPQIIEPDDEVTFPDGVLVGIDDSLLENSLVKKSDSMLLTVDISTPQVGDTFTVNGKNYKYVAHTTVNPAALVMLYKIALRI